MIWSKHPVIYEINTWVWLTELTQKYRRPLTLATIPPEEWDAIAKLGMDAVWLMGVWERSPAGREIALKNEQLLKDFRRALPDFQAEDVVGSPYCIRNYTVDKRLGGIGGLAMARADLAERNIQLILDLVPNHLAPDHPWVSDHPEYFIRGDRNDLARDPASFFETGGNIFARGRDPYFPAWPDVLQLNAFHEGLRHAAVDTLISIAEHADGVRCDMAMLLLNDVFAQTWGNRAGPTPPTEYWSFAISAVKQRAPNFIFIAESYWNLEWKLQQQGFDFCYDKRLYDRMCYENAESTKGHLHADLSYQGRLIRFLENHDEPRAASIFSPEKEEAAAVMVMTLPGAKLLHEGQLDGRKRRLPVFLSRRADEPADQDLRDFYIKLLNVLNRETFRNGTWTLCELGGWPDNPSFQNLISSCWSRKNEKYLIVINFSETASQGLVKVSWDDLQGAACQLRDLFSGEVYERDGNEMRSPGLFVNLKPWATHCFKVEISPGERSARKRITQNRQRRQKRGNEESFPLPEVASTER